MTQTASRRRSVTGILCLLGSAALLPGCDAVRGRMEPRLEQKLAERLAAVRPVDLVERSTAPPRSVEESLPGTLGRRSTTQPATERRELDIAAVRGAALENNLALQVALVDPAIARTVLSEQQAKFDQIIYVNLKRQRQDLPPIDDELVPLTRDAQQNQFFVYEPGVVVPLPTGGTVTLSVPFSKKKLDFEEKDNQYLAGYEFSLSQPLLRDGGVEVTTASIRLARYAAAETDTRTVLSAIGLLAETERAYWRLYQAWQALEIWRRQYELAYDNFELVSKGVAAGRLPMIEEVRAQVGVTDQLEDVIIAETALRLAQRELRRLIAPAELAADETRPLLVPTSVPFLAEYSFDREALVAEALAQRLELLALEFDIAAAALRIDVARNRALPRLDLTYEYSVLGRGSSFGDAFDSANTFDRAGWLVGLRGELPVTNQQRLSQLRRAVLERYQRLASREQRVALVRQEVLDAVDQLQQNWQRILAARQNVIVAGRVYELEQTQFREGLRTQREVIEALRQLGYAQVREVAAMVEYQIAQVDLALATGTLLGHSKVDLSPLPVLDGVPPTDLSADARPGGLVE